MEDVRQNILDHLIPGLDVMILIFRNESGFITYISPNTKGWLSEVFPKQKIKYLADVFGAEIEEKIISGRFNKQEEFSYTCFSRGLSALFKLKIVPAENKEESFLLIRKGIETTESAKFYEFINLFPEIYFETNEKGNITFLNKIGCQKIGLGPDDNYKQKNIQIRDIVLPDDLDRLVFNFKKNLEDEKSQENEYGFLTLSGEKLYLNIFSNGMFDSQGNTKGIRGIAIDITDRKLEQQKYHKQSLQISLLNELNNSSSISVFFKIAGSQLKHTFNLNMIELFAVEQGGDETYFKCFYNDILENRKKFIKNLIGQKYREIKFYIKGQFWKAFYEQENLVQIKSKDEIVSVIGEMLDNSSTPLNKLAKLFSKLLPMNYLLLVPLVVDHKTIGHCAVERKTPFQEEELRTIQLFIQTIALFFHRKNIEQKLIESEEKYRTIFDNSSLGIYRLTPEGLLLEANDSLAYIFGFSSGPEMIASTWNIEKQYNLHPEIRKEIIRNLEDGGNIIHKEIVLKRRDGTLFDGVIHMKSIMDDKGKILYFDGLLEDITERKFSEEKIKHDENLLKQQNKKLKKVNKQIRKINVELKLAKEKAEESDRLKSAFLANMSHEIRTPLNGIMGFSFLLADKNFKQEKRIQYAQIINESSNQLLNIVNDILDISKIETNQISISKSEIDVGQLLTELYDFFTPDAGRKNLWLKLECDKNNPSFILKSDSSRLKQIIINFISNALKFTEEGGITFGYTVRDKEVVFFVRDTGIGIREQEQKFIFDRFRQVGGNSYYTSGGTGLGLAISKGLAKLMNGEIKVESEFGKGSVFYFILPVNQ